MIFGWHRGEFERFLALKAALPHAILLRGRQGIGKLDFARALAEALLCEHPQSSGFPCKRCDGCHWFEIGVHPDYRQIEPTAAAGGGGEDDGDKKASTQISVQQIRGLADFTNNTSQRGGPKVILVHPAEALNVNAANALLKSLEEPPPRTFFIMVSHRPHLLLPTIRSRCHQVALPGPDAGVAESWLRSQGVANPELGLAQSSNSPLLVLQLDEDYWRLRDQLLTGLTMHNFDALQLAEDLRDGPIPKIVACLQRWTYDLVSQKLLGKVRYNPDRKAALIAAAAGVDKLAALRFHRHVVRMQKIVHHPLNARLFLEQLLLSYAELLQPSSANT